VLKGPEGLPPSKTANRRGETAPIVITYQAVASRPAASNTTNSFSGSRDQGPSRILQRELWGPSGVLASPVCATTELVLARMFGASLCGRAPTSYLTSTDFLRTGKTAKRITFVQWGKQRTTRSITVFYFFRKTGMGSPVPRRPLQSRQRHRASHSQSMPFLNTALSRLTNITRPTIRGLQGGDIVR